MNAPQKFLFDTCFEPDEDIAGPAGRGEQTPAEPSYSAAEFEAARRESFAQGREAGLEAARAEIETGIQQSLDALEVGLKDLAECAGTAATAQERSMLRLNVAMLRRLFPRLMADHGLAEIEAVVRDCLHRLRDEPRLVVRVADPLLDEIEKRVGALAGRAGFEGRIVFLAQDDLMPGDVLVEWADGGAERNGEALWNEMERALSRVLGAGAGAAEDAPVASNEQESGGTEPGAEIETEAVVSA